MKDFVADWLLRFSSGFNTLGLLCKSAAIRVLISRRRRVPADRSDGGLDIETKHTEIS